MLVDSRSFSPTMHGLDKSSAVDLWELSDNSSLSLRNCASPSPPLHGMLSMGLSCWRVLNLITFRGLSCWRVLNLITFRAPVSQEGCIRMQAQRCVILSQSGKSWSGDWLLVLDVAQDIIALGHPPSLNLHDMRPPCGVQAGGPSRSSTIIRAAREDLLCTPTRPRISKHAATHRVSAPDPSCSPPPQAYWMGDNQRSLMQDHSSAQTRIRRRKSEPLLSKDVPQDHQGPRDENTPPVS
jgi:hypothetical protein